jgi:hypothetical protein
VSSEHCRPAGFEAAGELTQMTEDASEMGRWEAYIGTPSGIEHAHASCEGLPGGCGACGDGEGPPEVARGFGLGRLGLPCGVGERSSYGRGRAFLLG